MSLFELNLGWNPKSPLEFLSGSECLLDSFDEFKLRLQISLERAKFGYEVEKAMQSASSYKKYKRSD